MPADLRCDLRSFGGQGVPFLLRLQHDSRDWVPFAMHRFVKRRHAPAPALALKHEGLVEIDVPAQLARLTTKGAAVLAGRFANRGHGAVCGKRCGQEPGHEGDHDVLDEWGQRVRSRREKILGLMTDMGGVKLFWDDRKEDEDLPRDSIEEAVAAGEVTADEMIEAFAKAVRAALE